MQPLGTVPASGRRMYVVQEGDTLYSIARAQLGRATRWVEIYDLNRQQLGDQFESPSPGMQLVLPAESGAAAPGAAERSGLAYPR